MSSPHSNTTRLLWEQMRRHNLVYVLVAAMWVLPILIGLPKSFESDVEYRSGKGSDIGAICYVVEGGNRTLFSDVQYFTNLATDVVLLAVITVCYVIIFWKLRKLAQQAREEIQRSLTEDRCSITSSSLIDFEVRVKTLQKSLSAAVGLIYVCYAVLRLPLVICGNYFGPEGGVDSDNGISLWLVICIIIYQIQFCVNFIIYAVLMANYREAFLDIIRMMCPCFFKRLGANNNVDVPVEEN